MSAVKKPRGKSRRQYARLDANGNARFLHTGKQTLLRVWHCSLGCPIHFDLPDIFICLY